MSFLSVERITSRICDVFFKNKWNARLCKMKFQIFVLTRARTSIQVDVDDGVSRVIGVKEDL